MLPPFIIEQLIERERRNNRSETDQQPRLELPLPEPKQPPCPPDAESERGVVIVPLF